MTKSFIKPWDIIVFITIIISFNLISMMYELALANFKLLWDNPIIPYRSLTEVTLIVTSHRLYRDIDLPLAGMDELIQTSTDLKPGFDRPQLGFFRAGVDAWKWSKLL